MALIYEKGTIAHMGDLQTGTSKAGKEWARMTIVVEIPDYNDTTRKIALEAFTNIIQDVQSHKVGDKVEIGYAVSAREWQGKWYNNVELHVIKADGQAPAKTAPAPTAPATEEGEMDMPF